ncbi:MAG: hypothetical protein CMF31_08905 [Kordiimonas sp.]|nr:hypothetical protein [Kordiimonas sp.]|tara:strand:+ start:6941 stop:8065 length:1125 start_codon:yes stop_codon:yes gene_type:complete
MNRGRLEQQRYIPVMKTSDAELKGMHNLSGDVLDALCPMFELTKSRFHKNTNPDSKVERRMKVIQDIMGERPFILDLIGEERFQNKEIKQFFDETDGYQNWRNFLVSHDWASLIPTLLLDGDASVDNLTEQARQLEADFGAVCLRIGCVEHDEDDSSAFEFFDDDVEDFVRPVFEALDNTRNCILMIDVGFIPYGEMGRFADCVMDIIAKIENLGLGSPKTYVPIGSSFPQMVAQKNYGDDRHGIFPMLEWTMFLRLRDRGIDSLTYGDYASIHPLRYNALGYNWVPRVDAPMADKYIYHRYRREIVGKPYAGYDLAAEYMLNDPEYESCDSWGDKQIRLAAAHDKDVGRGPASWIAIRENIHITRRVRLLESL